MAKVLIVLDDEFGFEVANGPDLDFTYTELVNALPAAGHQITKALGGTDASPGVIQSFKFANPLNLLGTPLNLLDFDVIWLISHAGRNSPDSTGTSGLGIGDDQVAAIARFMEA